METYREFLDRINLFQKSEIDFGNEYFSGNPSIAQKVNKENVFRAFYGDTVVFNLDDSTKEKLTKIVNRINDVASECFCEKLVPNTFHMTLHDLSNSPKLEEIAQEVFENELKVLKIAENMAEEKIKMKTKFIFNMVNTSLVLGLYPINETEFNKLMKLYTLIDDVKKLGYPLTPHITLGYYNVNGFSVASARKLEAIVKELNTTESEIQIELDTKELFYQKFVSMDEYINIFRLAKKR
jgi:2'-5' RNA ligase